MATQKTATTRLSNLTGADHACFMLLAAIDSMRGYDASRLSTYRAAARAILRSPNAFNGGHQTLSIADYVLKADLSLPPDTDREQAFNTALARILQGAEGENVTVNAYHLRMLLYHVIEETTLYAAAVTYELLKGGAR